MRPVAKALSHAKPLMQCIFIFSSLDDALVGSGQRVSAERLPNHPRPSRPSDLSMVAEEDRLERPIESVRIQVNVGAGCEVFDLAVTIFFLGIGSATRKPVQSAPSSAPALSPCYFTPS